MVCYCKPTAGNGAAKKKWLPVFNELTKQNFVFDFEITQYKKHVSVLIKKLLTKELQNLFVLEETERFIIS